MSMIKSTGSIIPTQKHHLAHFFAFFLIFITIFGTISAYAHAPAHYTTTFATVNSDMWVRAKVLSFEASISEDFEYMCGTTYEAQVTLDIMDSTDSDFIGQLELDIRLESAQAMLPGQEVFIALKANDEGYWERSPKGVYGWFCHKESESLRDYRTAQNADIMWFFLQDLRLVLDQKRVAPDGIRKYWTSLLYSEDGTPAQLMAWEIVNFMQGVEIDSVAIAESLTRQLTQILSLSDEESGEYDAALEIFIQLYISAMEYTIQSVNAEAATLLSRLYIDYEFIRRELGQHFSKLYQRNIEDSLVKLMLASPDQASVDAVASVLGDVIPLDSGVLRILGKTKGEAINALLWDITLHPNKYEIRTVSELSYAWRALAERGDPKLQSYLENNVLAVEKPRLEFLNEYMPDDENWCENVKMRASRIMGELAKSTLSRERYLQNRVDAMLAGENFNIFSFKDALRPEDTHLAKQLAKVKVRTSTDTFTKYIILTIPDPAFVPMLREWLMVKQQDRTREGPYLEALYACGDKDFVYNFIEKRLAQPFREETPSDYKRDIEERIRRLITLTTFDDPRAETLLQPYYDMTRFDQYAQQLISLVNNPDHTDSWARYHRNQLLPALAKHGGTQTISALHRAYGEPYLDTKLIAALCLYIMDDPMGREMIDAFRERRTPVSPKNKEYQYKIYFQLGRLHKIIREMNMPKLDALIVERIDKGLNGGDMMFIRDKSFVMRSGPSLMKKMVTYLDDPNPEIQMEMFFACQNVLNKRYVSSTYIGNTIITQCKQDMLAYIKSLEAKEREKELAQNLESQEQRP